MPDTNTTLPTAGLIRRLMAIVYDSLLLLGIAFAYGVILTIIRVSVLGRDELDYVNIPFVIHLLSWALLWGILAGYYVLCWTKRGQTLGMKTWRLRVEGSDGRLIDARTAWLRCALALASATVVGLGYLWCLYDKSGGCWHDRWTSSRVVELPKEKVRNG